MVRLDTVVVVVASLRPCTRHTSPGQRSAQKSTPPYAAGQIDRARVRTVEVEDFSGPSVLAVWLVRVRSAVVQQSRRLRRLRASILCADCSLPEFGLESVDGTSAVNCYPPVQSFGTRPTRPDQPYPRTLKPLFSRGSESSRLAPSSPQLHHQTVALSIPCQPSLCDKNLSHSSPLRLTPCRLEYLLLFLAALTPSLSLDQCNRCADMALSCFSEVNTLT